MGNVASMLYADVALCNTATEAINALGKWRGAGVDYDAAKLSFCTNRIEVKNLTLKCKQATCAEICPLLLTQKALKMRAFHCKC